MINLMDDDVGEVMMDDYPCCLCGGTGRTEFLYSAHIIKDYADLQRDLDEALAEIVVHKKAFNDLRYDILDHTETSRDSVAQFL